MQNFFSAVLVGLSIIFASNPASACRTVAKFELDDIKYASVVVIGRIVNYEIVREQGYARFNVLVDEVLAGQPQKIIPVTWRNSTFGLPKEMEGGSYLIGLRDPNSKSPPLRGPSATILPSPEPNMPTVLQAPCAPAFIFETSRPEAKAIRNRMGSTAK